MRRLKSEFHHPRAEGARGIVAHAFCQIGTVNIMYIAVDRVGFRIGKFGGKRGHDVVGREKVIGVEYADDIARSHCDSLVHRIIDAAVGLADVAQTPSVKRFKFADYLHRVVRRPAVDYDMLDLCVSLPEHRLHGVTHRRPTIVSGCYY